MNFVSQLLNQPERIWHRLSPAAESEIQALVNSLKFELPPEFLDLLRFSNGGEGKIALPPLIFCLDKIQEIISLINDEFYQSQFPTFLFFGGNGGLEMIAFDLRKIPFPIVMIDPIAGEESAIEIAPNINEFINAIGFEYKENAGT